MNSPPTWADVVAIAPELATVPTVTQTAVLASAIDEVSPAAWGTKTGYGIVYLAAHLATLSVSGGSLVDSESIGSMSRTYASPDGLKGSLSLTHYGAEYQRRLRLLASATLGMVV